MAAQNASASTASDATSAAGAATDDDSVDAPGQTAASGLAASVSISV
jgi:hypothetical protein